jgi:hypothetical protein
MKLWTARLAAGLIAFALAGGAVRTVQGQAQSAASAPILDVSGLWELSFDGRKVPAAQLTPAVTKAVMEAQGKHDDHAVRWCNSMGLPFVMDASRPLDIRQGKTEVVIAVETFSNPRHLYLDRKEHIAAELWDPSTNGDSIAHWEGDTLVVDTIGFSDTMGMLMIPGGGFRTAKSHLVERYRVLESGSVLSVTFTWTDPKVFRTPHTYEFRYDRLPAQFEPLPMARCDPYDPERTKFLEGPGTTMPYTSSR